MTFTLMPGLVEAFVISFARIGALMMTLPGLGERTIPARLRLLLALFTSLMALPLVREAGGGRGMVLTVMLVEVTVGLVLGLSVRLTLAALEMAGSFLAGAIGLSFAQALDPAQGQQTETLTRFLRMFGVAVIFSADLHHLALAGVFDSYRTVPVGALPPAQDVAALYIGIGSMALRAALGVAAPFLVFGFVFNAGLGLAARLAPQVQVFFLAMPASVALGLGALALTVAAIAARFEDFARQVILLVLPAGS